MKLNKLLPIVALTGITATIVPFVASCAGKGGNTPQPGDTIELTQQKSAFGINLIRNTTRMKIEPNKPYDIQISMSKWTNVSSMLDNENTWVWGFGEDPFNPDTSSPVSETSPLNKLYIGETEITDAVVKHDGIEFTALTLDENNSDADITKNDLIKVTLVFDQFVKDGYFYMMLWPA